MNRTTSLTFAVVAAAGALPGLVLARSAGWPAAQAWEASGDKFRVIEVGTDKSCSYDNTTRDNLDRVYEAKRHLASLLDDVERGETITITRHGHPIAELVPLRAPRRKGEDYLRVFRELRRGVRLDGPSIRELIDEGRRQP